MKNLHLFLDKFAKILIHMRNYFSGLNRCYGGCLYNYLVIGLRPYRYKPKIMKMYLVWQCFSLFTENPLSFDRCNFLCNEMRTMFLLTQETLWQLCCFRMLWNLTRNISKWSTDLKQLYHFNVRSVNKKWCVCFFYLADFQPAALIFCEETESTLWIRRGKSQTSTDNCHLNQTLPGGLFPIQTRIISNFIYFYKDRMFSVMFLFLFRWHSIWLLSAFDSYSVDSRDHKAVNDSYVM